MYLGLILGDQFETDKGDYVVTGIQFEGKERTGVIILPYITANDAREKGKFLSDKDIEKNWDKLKYKKNEL